MGKLQELYTPFIFTSHLKFAATKEEFYMKQNTDSVKYSQYPNFYFSTLSSFKKTKTNTSNLYFRWNSTLSEECLYKTKVQSTTMVPYVVLLGHSKPGPAFSSCATRRSKQLSPRQLPRDGVKLLGLPSLPTEESSHMAQISHKSTHQHLHDEKLTAVSHTRMLLQKYFGL